MTKTDFEQDGSAEEFFYWIKERQRIYLKKEAGRKPPWTKDEVLRDYFFCNVFREQDRVTQAIREIYREDPEAHRPELLVFNLVLARFFNYIPTLEHIGFTVNWPRRRAKGICASIREFGLEHGQTFNSAYLVAGSDLAGKDKTVGVCERLDIAWNMRERIATHIEHYPTLEDSWHVLQELPGVAGFLAYEIVTDLRHTYLLNRAPDIMTWANPGPGAIRGLQRIWGKNNVSRQSAISHMRTLLAASKKGTKLDLEMRDIEHSLCEYDKYKRIKLGQGNVRRYHG